MFPSDLGTTYEHTMIIRGEVRRLNSPSNRGLISSGVIFLFNSVLSCRKIIA